MKTLTDFRKTVETGVDPRLSSCHRPTHYIMSASKSGRPWGGRMYKLVVLDGVTQVFLLVRQSQGPNWNLQHLKLYQPPPSWNTK